MPLDLSHVKETREKPIVELPISDEELITRYSAVFTAAINDVLRERGYLYQTLPNDIQPLLPGMRVVGFAFTIKGSKNLRLEDEMMDRAKMLDSIKKYDVCVWDTSGDDESAQWGEMMTKCSKMHGCVGAVVDGGLRDVRQVKETGFPVFRKYHSSNGMMGRFRMIGYQMPIHIGNVDIFPGDIIMGDDDGVIVIPREMAISVLERAEEIRDEERDKVDPLIKKGLTAVEVVEQGGYF